MEPSDPSPATGHGEFAASNSDQREPPEPLAVALNQGPAATADVLEEVVKGLAVWPGYERTPDTTTVLSVYEKSLGRDDRDILRDALVVLLERASDPSSRLADREVSDIVHLASQFELPQHRAPRTSARLEHVWRMSALLENRTLAARILGLLAENGTLRPAEHWIQAYALIGPVGAVSVFRGLARVDVATALEWLSGQQELDNYRAILAAVIPHVIHESGRDAVEDALWAIPELGTELRDAIQKRIDLESRYRPVGASETRRIRSEAVARADMQAQSDALMEEIYDALDREPAIEDFAMIDETKTSPAAALNAWMTIAPETMEDIDGRDLMRIIGATE
jgi:hypothetical protein